MKILIVGADARTLRRHFEPLADVSIHANADLHLAAEALDVLAPDLIVVSTGVVTSGVATTGAATKPCAPRALDFLRAVRSCGCTVPVVVVAATARMEDVRDAMRGGAQDFLLRSELGPQLLTPILDNFRARKRLRRPVAVVRRPAGPAGRTETDVVLPSLVGASPRLAEARRLVRKLARASCPVLIRGATGTGKELVARALHDESARRGHPFIPVNCATLPPALIDSLIFGHERGAFTGADRRTRGYLELADMGTILFDEVAEMPVEVQAKLLRVIEEKRYRPLGADTERTFSARILAATHVDLERYVATGRFREDLYHRLNVVTIELPRLGERVKDIPALVAVFVAEGERALRFTDGSLAWLMARRWPGNVRELKNAVARIALLADEDVIEPALLAKLLPDRFAPDAQGELDGLARSLLSLTGVNESKIRAFERALLRFAVRECGGNRSAAARLLGVDRKALDRRWERDAAAAARHELARVGTRPRGSGHARGRS